MPTATHSNRHRPTLTEKLLRPRNVVDLVMGTVAACLVIGLVALTILAKPYRQSQDIRQQAAIDPIITPPTDPYYTIAPQLSISPTRPPSICLPCTDPRVDINHDGVINQADVSLYTSSCLNKPPSASCPDLNQQGVLISSADMNCLVRCLAPTATPIPPSTPPTPTTSILNCNQTCTSNNQCGVNMRCYQVGNEYKCRLAAYPSSDSCQAPADGGLNRSCNEYCADSRECQSGLTCWYNRCRRPDNVDNTSCQATTQAVQTAMQNSCNQSCSTSRDCAVNLRCYQNRCRLAINPSSASCQTAPRATVTSLPQKGAEISITPPPTTKPSPVDSSGAGVLLTDSPTPETPSLAPTATQISDESTADGGLLGSLRSFFTNLFEPEQANTRRMLLAVLAAGLVLIGLAFVISALKKSGDNPPPPPSGPTTKPPSAASAAQHPTQTPPFPNTESPPPSTLTTMETDSSSMTSRLKQKGVTPPT